MAKSLVLLLAAAALFAAGDPWTKVKVLKEGADLSIRRQGATKPLEAKFDEARDDTLVVIVRNEQQAIPKAEIDRIDHRPAGRQASSELQRGMKVPDGTPPVFKDRPTGDGYSGGVTLAKRPYETIYRRPLR